MKNRKVMTHQDKCLVKAYNETNGTLKVKVTPRSEQKGSTDLPLFVAKSAPSLFDEQEEDSETITAVAIESGCNPDVLQVLEIADLWNECIAY